MYTKYLKTLFFVVLQLFNLLSANVTTLKSFFFGLPIYIVELENVDPVPENNIMDDKIVASLIGCGVFSVTTAGMIYFGPDALGVSTAGITKDSVMAAIQSQYGNVAKGSWFAAVQSWGAKGAAGLATGSAISGALSGASCLALASQLWDELPPEYFGPEAIKVYKDYTKNIVLFKKDGHIFKVENLTDYYNLAEDHVVKFYKSDNVQKYVDKIGGGIEVTQMFINDKAITVREFLESEPVQEKWEKSINTVKDGATIVKNKVQTGVTAAYDAIKDQDAYVLVKKFVDSGVVQDFKKATAAGKSVKKVFFCFDYLIACEENYF